MQPTEHHRTVQMLIHDWPAFPCADGLCPPDAESLLREVLAAARDTVARCEHGLALLARHQCLEPDTRACAARDADMAVTGAVAITSAAWRDQKTSRDVADDGSGVRPEVTLREMEVALLIADGLSNKQIAAQLYLSVRTVERHITNLYAKIGAYGKADATAWVLRNTLG